MHVLTHSLHEIPASVEHDIAHFWDGTTSYLPIWQQTSWARMLMEAGGMEEGFFVGVYKSEKLVSYALVEKRAIGLGKYGYFCVGGPNVREASCFSLLEDAMIELVCNQA